MHLTIIMCDDIIVLSLLQKARKTKSIFVKEKIMKRVLSFIMSTIMIVGVLSGLSFSVQAADAELGADSACSGHRLGQFAGVPACVSANGSLHVCENNFPDANFRSGIEDNFESAYLSQTDAQNETYFDFMDRGILSLQGIEYFINLKTLWVINNRLTELDLSNNINLKELYCYNNYIKNLDISKNTKLEDLDCANNNLTTLDVSNKKALKYLSCGGNKLTNLDVTDNPELIELKCSSNNLDQLNVTNNTKLEYLGCYWNNLTSLDVSRNVELTVLYCRNNNITSLDVSKNTKLEEFSCNGNQLTSLDLTNNKSIMYGLCSDNNVSGLIKKTNSEYIFDLSKYISLENLDKVTIISPDSARYNSDVGTVVFAEKPKELVYTYDTGIEFCPLEVCFSLSEFSSPTDIEITARGGDGERARIDWTAAEGATRYEVYDITKGKNVLKGETTDPYFIFDDLTPGWTYEVKVIAYNDEGDSAESESYTFGAACPTVQNLRAEATGTNTIKAQWNVTTSHGYYLQWSTTPDFSSDVNGTYISGTNSTSYTITTSKPADQYYVRVRAYKLFELGGTIYGAFTDAVSLAGQLIPVTGIELTARGGDGERARIDWNESAGATRYEVYDITKGKNVLKGETTDPYFIFDDLTPGWTYEVKVIAYNDEGDSAESESYTFGAACPTVQEISASLADTNTIDVEWSETTSHGYYLQWSTTSDFSGDVYGTYISGTSSTSYTIKTSKSADLYYVRVRAYKLFELGGTIYGAFTQPVDIMGIEITARGGDGERARIDWNDTEGAVKYEVYDITKGKNVLKGTTIDPYFVFDDLTPGWTYEVKVIAYDSSNKKLYESESYTFGAACPTVQNLRAEATGTNTIKAEWDVTTSHGYYLQWSTTPDFSGDVNGTYISGTNSTSYTITTSKPADQYYVRVRAYKLFELGGTIYGAFTQAVEL